MLDVLAVILLLGCFFAFASSAVRAALRRFYDNRLHGVLMLFALLIPYLLVALPGAGAAPAAFLSGVARMLAYLLLPGLLLIFRPVRNAALDVWDILAVLALWFPIEFGWLPDLDAQLPGGVNLPLALLTAICLGFLLYTVIRPLDGLGYTYRLGWSDLRDAGLGFGFFALLGLPLGVGMGFIRFNPAVFDPGAWLSRFVLIYFLNALPEELLFRGALQNLIEKRLGVNWTSLVLAALVFGISHLNNTTAFHQPPNWPYVAMAGLAGLGYGWAWRRSRKITASALTHTLVNFTWSILFAS